MDVGAGDELCEGLIQRGYQSTNRLRLGQGVLIKWIRLGHENIVDPILP